MLCMLQVMSATGMGTLQNGKMRSFLRWLRQPPIRAVIA